MARYVLRVLEGSSPEQRIPLTPGRNLSIGRKADCDLSFPSDANISGRHAELRWEGDVLILADLDSTNGTRVDGKKIRELPIGHGDAFQIGGVRLSLVDEERALPDEDLGLRIDETALARSSRRSGALFAILALLLILAGGGAWFYLSSEGTKARTSRGLPVVEVPGNLLPAAAAHFEDSGAEEAWIAHPAGAGFRVGRPGRTGSSALAVDLGAGLEGGEPKPFAVLSLASPLSAGRKSSFRLSVWVRGEKGTRVGIFLAGYEMGAASGEEEEEEGGRPSWSPPAFLGGGAFVTCDGGDWKELEYVGRRPGNTPLLSPFLVVLAARDRAAEGSGISFDDLALVETPSEETRLQIAGRSVEAADAGWSDFRIAVGKDLVLRRAGFRPAGKDDAALSALARVALLPLAAGFTACKGKGEPKGFRLRLEGEGRFVCDLTASALEGGSYLLDPIGEDGKARGFDRFSGRHEEASFRALAVGDGLHRMVLLPERGRGLRVEDSGDGSLRLSFDPGGGVFFQLDFTEEIGEARQLLSRAEDALQEKDRGKALAAYTEILRRVPFYDAAVRTAALQRARILDEARRVWTRFGKDFEEASNLDYLTLYEDLLRRLKAEIEGYGSSELQGPLEELAGKVGARIEVLRKSKAEEDSVRMLAVYRALKEAGKVRLALEVARDLCRSCPGTKAAEEMKGEIEALERSLEDG